MQGGGEILVLLDLSSAFDTIDHAVLFDLWHDTFGISGTALSVYNLTSNVFTLITPLTTHKNTPDIHVCSYKPYTILFWPGVYYHKHGHT